MTSALAATRRASHEAAWEAQADLGDLRHDLTLSPLFLLAGHGLLLSRPGSTTLKAGSPILQDMTTGTGERTAGSPSQVLTAEDAIELGELLRFLCDLS